MELLINKVHYEVSELNELQAHLIHVRRRQFAEIGMQHAENSPAPRQNACDAKNQQLTFLRRIPIPCTWMTSMPSTRFKALAQN